MTTILIYGDTERSAALRHELPVAIGDPFLFVSRNGRVVVLTSVLEQARIAEARPDAELLLMEELGLRELRAGGMSSHEAELEVTVRAVQRIGLTSALVPPDLPLAVADRLRAEGIELTVDVGEFDARRRSKTAAELAGIRRAQKAADAAMGAAAALIRESVDVDGTLQHAGEPLTAEAVRAAARAACAAAGAPAPPDIMVTSHRSGGGHDPGSGPLPAQLPITIDLWPRDEETGCWADMTRTFVAGAVTETVARLDEIVRGMLEAVRAATRPGITGDELYALAAGLAEQAGFPTQRTAEPGKPLAHGFYFSLGHGVGLEVHEAPSLGLGSTDVLVPGDVIAVEPGLEGLEGIGGVRFEDLLLVTEHGCETLTDFPYDLKP